MATTTWIAHQEYIRGIIWLYNNSFFSQNPICFADNHLMRDMRVENDLAASVEQSEGIEMCFYTSIEYNETMYEAGQ